MKLKQSKPLVALLTIVLLLMLTLSSCTDYVEQEDLSVFFENNKEHFDALKDALLENFEYLDITYCIVENNKQGEIEALGFKYHFIESDGEQDDELYVPIDLSGTQKVILRNAINLIDDFFESDKKLKDYRDDISVRMDYIDGEIGFVISGFNAEEGIELCYVLSLDESVNKHYKEEGRDLQKLDDYWRSEISVFIGRE